MKTFFTILRFLLKNLSIFTWKFNDFHRKMSIVKYSCKGHQIFVQKSSRFLKILLLNPHNDSAKHVNLQLAHTPVFDKCERCYQYTQSMCIYSQRRKSFSGILFCILVTASSLLSIEEYCFPISTIFSLEKRNKSATVISGEYGLCVIQRYYFLSVTLSLYIRVFLENSQIWVNVFYSRALSH